MAVLAHQGGWDEILFVVLPLAVCAWLLWTANRRVKRQVAASQDPATENVEAQNAAAETGSDPNQP